MFDSTVIGLVERIKVLFDSRGIWLALAESCTGGLVGGALTEVPGASSFFLGSAGTYSNSAKTSILSVSPQVLSRHGAVSPQCAQAMAYGAMELYRSNVALSVTGIAGPDGGSIEKPVGLVWFGLAIRGEQPRSINRVFPGDRNDIRRSTVLEALRYILMEVS